MKKGNLLGSGVTAEVYEWGQDRILKLYFAKYSIDDWVNYEAKIGHIVHESGITSPAVYDIVEVGDRKGIIYQRIHGKSIVECLVTEPWKLYYYVQKTADLQHKIHNFSADGLPTQKERFTYAIRFSSHILGYRAKKILDYMEGLQDGESICHGDLYHNNIIVSGKKMVPIDWSTAYKGNPLGDVARTGMIICSPAVPYGIPFEAGMLAYYPKWLAFKVYINEYMKLAKVKYEDIDAWVLPVAAAKLKDKIPGERKWLMGIIDKRLEQLD
jgi:uncharacterized protein (TIGR02172 family)